MNDIVVSVLISLTLLAGVVGVGLYYWLSFVALCPTGCGL